MQKSWLTAFAAVLFSVAALAAPVELLNVSYDPTREFFEEYNALFQKYWKQKTGDTVTVLQSHGGSGKQARAVIDGLKADVATLALAYDIDAIAAKTDVLPRGWQKKFPYNSAPWTSSIVLLVRKGNPKNIKDWGDLVRKDMQVITPNPKTSGGARWNYLAAWAYAQHIFSGNENQSKEFMRRLLANVPVLDAGARGSTTTFVMRGIGDVLISWENEALLVTKRLKPDEFEIINPSLSILAEPPVAVLEKNTEAKGTTKAAQAYLQYLYSAEAQELAAKHYGRPSDEATREKYAALFPPMNLLTIADFGGWDKVQKKHFADGGIFDEIYSE